MKKIILLLIITVFLLTSLGCQSSAESKNNSKPSPIVEEETFDLTLKVIEYNKKDDIISASEVFNSPNIDYYISMDNSSNLESFEAGDIIVVTTNAIMESYPAQVVASNIQLATSEQIDEIQEDIVCTEPAEIEFETIFFSNYPVGLEEQLIASKEEPGHDFITLDNEVYMVIYMGQRNTGGYSIQVENIIDHGESKIVYVYESSPPKDGMVTMAITYPLTVIKLPNDLDTEQIQVERLTDDDSTLNLDNDF